MRKRERKKERERERCQIKGRGGQGEGLALCYPPETTRPTETLSQVTKLYTNNRNAF